MPVKNDNMKQEEEMKYVPRFAPAFGYWEGKTETLHRAAPTNSVVLVG
jgi:hypothetical protein